MPMLSKGRNPYRRSSAAVIRCTALALMFGPWAGNAGGQCSYEVSAVLEAPVSCGILGPALTFATAINDNGVVTGYYRCLGEPKPFLWSEDTGFVLIPLPPGVSDATPAHVNNNAEIVGTMNEFSSGALPFHWKGGVWTELALLPGFPEARAFGINDKSEIVGESFDAFSFSPFRALIWRGGMVSELSLPIGPQSSATAINSSPQIAGWMGEGGGTGASVGFLMSEGNVTEIPPLPRGIRNDPVAINEQGVVTGVTLMPVKNNFFPRRSWVFADGILTDLGALPTINHRTIAKDVSDAIQIVGVATNPPPQQASAPFLWQHGLIHDLRPFVTGAPNNLNLTSADGINEQGHIICGALIGSKIVAVVLTPIDQPLGDVNFDCTVDEHDLMAVLENWGEDKAGHPTDMVSSATFEPPGDGRVDAADLAVVLGNWSRRP